MVARVKAHNKEVVSSAEFRAREMDVWPSPLEEKMKVLLDRYDIRYETQKIFYIYADDGWIIRYYIADFYIPDKKVVIEVDGKFHDKQKQKDKMRTRDIQEHYPGIDVVRWKAEDFKNPSSIEELLNIVS